MVRPVCEYCQVKIWRQTELVSRYFACQNLDACEACATQFFGVYDLQNPALAGVLRCRQAGKKLRWIAARSWDQKQVLARLQVAYATRVRSLSRALLKRNAGLLNPNNRRIGRAGVVMSYQLDHIVPVIMCFEHYVSPEDAAALPNLQVVHWSMNVARSGHLSIEQMVGFDSAGPDPIEIREAERRPNAAACHDQRLSGSDAGG